MKILDGNTNTTTKLSQENFLKMFIQLTAIAFIAFGIIISWFTTGHPQGHETWQLPTFSICYNLSYGYLASYIFYIINVHLPQVKKRNEDHDALGWAIARILYNLNILKKTYNISTNQEDLGQLETRKHERSKPIFIVLFTKSTSGLTGYTDFAPEHISEDTKRQINNISKHYLSKTLNSSPYLAILLALYGIAHMLKEVLNYTERLNGIEKMTIHNIISTIDHKITESNLNTLAVTPPDIDFLALESMLVDVNSQLTIFFENSSLFSRLVIHTPRYKKQIDSLVASHYQKHIEYSSARLQHTTMHKKSPA